MDQSARHGGSSAPQAQQHVFLDRLRVLFAGLEVARSLMDGSAGGKTPRTVIIYYAPLPCPTGHPVKNCEWLCALVQCINAPLVCTFILLALSASCSCILFYTRRLRLHRHTSKAECNQEMGARQRKRDPPASLCSSCTVQAKVAHGPHEAGSVTCRSMQCGNRYHRLCCSEDRVATLHECHSFAACTNA